VVALHLEERAFRFVVGTIRANQAALGNIGVVFGAVKNDKRVGTWFESFRVLQQGGANDIAAIGINGDFQYI